MTKPDETKRCIDLSCKQTTENDVETKEGQRTTHSAVYKGTVLIGNVMVAIQLKLSSDDRAALELCVPLTVGATRKMELSRTNEDLDNHHTE